MDWTRFKFSILLLVALLCSSVIAQTRPAPVDSASDWKEFSSAEGQFTVSLPGPPKVDIATVGTPVGPLKSHFFVVETEKFFITFPMSTFQRVRKHPRRTKRHSTQAATVHLRTTVL